MTVMIEEALRQRIEDLDTPAAGRIYREFIEQQPERLPVVCFQRTGGAPMRRDLVSGIPVLQRASIRVEIIAETSMSSAQMVAALRAGLDGWRGMSAGLEVLRCACVFEGEASFVDGDLKLKIVQQDYDLVYR